MKKNFQPVNFDNDDYNPAFFLNHRLNIRKNQLLVASQLSLIPEVKKNLTYIT